MSKLLRVLSFIVIMLVVICYSANSYAINMNLDENNTTNTISNTAENANTDTTSDTTTESGNRGNFTTQITVSTQELTISNALSICLIAVGIVLILLSIAILIKLKN